MTDVELLQALDKGEAQDWEFKSAKGGVPATMYETYSAMANSKGGVIVLGIQEKHGVFTVDGVPDPAKAQKSIWDTLNNRGRTSVNLLESEDVTALDIDDKTVIVMSIPKADRRRRPVYIGMNPLEGTFRRNYEGDYLCTRDEVGRMLADQTEETPDCRILENFTLQDLDIESLRQYRNRVASRSPDLAWLGLEDKDFLQKLGGWRVDRRTGREGLTVAGLLMFGKEEAIRDPDAVPNFHIDYREKFTDAPEVRWDDRIYPDGMWNANIFQFYQRVIVRATRDLKTPFHLEELARVDDTPVHKALREALTNSIIHADYKGQGGVVITRRKRGFEFSNPGSLLVSYEQLISGGISECRNKSLQLMFQMMGRGEKAGTGIDTILQGWRSEAWQWPNIEEKVEPDRVVLRLPMVSMIAPESMERLRARFGDRIDGLPPLEIQALVTADIEGSVSNARLQLISEIHPVELTKVLQRLVANEFLSRGPARSKFYTLHSTNSIAVPDTNMGGSSHTMGGNLPYMGSDAVSEGSSPHSVPPLGESEINRLRAIAYPDGVPKRVERTQMQQAILSVCVNSFRTAIQLGQILQRNSDALRDQYLTPMVRQGDLHTLFPNAPSHAQQAYRAAKSLFDEASDAKPDRQV